jgi:hypothetical protein
MILGDGYITKNNYLRIGHSCKQEEYLEHKKKLLENVELKVSKTYTILKNQYCNKTFESREPILYKHYRHQFYPNGNKTVTRHLLNQLDANGLAIWFMDDGSCTKKYKNGYGNGRYLQISTHSFTKEENNLILNYLDKVWNIQGRIRIAKKKDKPEYFYITFNVNNSIKFIDIIKPYIIESMKYKIDFNYDYTNSSNERPDRRAVAIV